MHEQDTSHIDSIWQELTTKREIDLSEARATYHKEVAEAERLFGYRLADRLVGEIVARREAQHPSPPIQESPNT